MDACLGGSGTCYGIKKENVNKVLELYSIKTFDTSSLREYKGNYMFSYEGTITSSRTKHNTMAKKDADAIIITDEMEIINLNPEIQPQEKTKEYIFIKNDKSYNLYEVLDK